MSEFSIPDDDENWADENEQHSANEHILNQKQGIISPVIRKSGAFNYNEKKRTGNEREQQKAEKA